MSQTRVNEILDRSGGNNVSINGIVPAIASQAEVEAGLNNTKIVTPLANLQAGVGAPHFVLEDQKSSGTNGQTLATANTWITRDLNTEIRDVLNIVSIATNQFTVTQNCWVEWQCSGRDAHITRLFNVTDSITIATSTTATASGIGQITRGCGAVEAGKTYRIEVNTATAGQIHSPAAARGVPEVYTRIQGWRIP